MSIKHTRGVCILSAFEIQVLSDIRHVGKYIYEYHRSEQSHSEMTSEA